MINEIYKVIALIIQLLLKLTQQVCI